MTASLSAAPTSFATQVVSGSPKLPDETAGALGMLPELAAPVAGGAAFAPEFIFLAFEVAWLSVLAMTFCIIMSRAACMFGTGWREYATPSTWLHTRICKNNRAKAHLAMPGFAHRALGAHLLLQGFSNKTLGAHLAVPGFAHRARGAHPLLQGFSHRALGAHLAVPGFAATMHNFSARSCSTCDSGENLDMAT